MKTKKTLSLNLGTAWVVVMVVLSVTSVFAPTAWGASKYKTLYKFRGGADGNRPEAGLIFDHAGNLYGTTQIGGANECPGRIGCGTVFRLTPKGDGSWRESVLHSFSSGEANDPEYASLIFDASENLYGVTSEGGAPGTGTVFELANGSWNETILHLFGSGNDGYGPAGQPIFDHAGNLYGTTYQGGLYSVGTVFQLTPNGDGSWTENILYSFGQSSNDASHPVAGLIFDAAGNLYGTTQVGGNGAGTVFKLTPNGDGTWTENVLHSFQPKKGGYIPYGRLIFDKTGNLFGTTAGGGASGYGTVYILKPTAKGGWKETVLHSFKDLLGATPFSGLIFDGQGTFYGTTSGDDKTTFGSVFSITP
jgi:uncharacterized repeat protein (TIGR03803 family)